MRQSKRQTLPWGRGSRTFKGAATSRDTQGQIGPILRGRGDIVEDVLRNEKALDYARNYIVNNPVTWLKNSLRI